MFRESLVCALLLCACDKRSPCDQLEGARFETVEAVGCFKQPDCSHHLPLTFTDSKFVMDLDDTNRGGPFTCEGGTLKLDDMKAELSEDGKRLTVHAPWGAVEYERS